MKTINKGYWGISRRYVALSGACMMRTRLHLGGMTINYSFGSPYLMEKIISLNSISIKLQLRLSAGALSKEVYWLREEAPLISVSAFGTLLTYST
jgi:hypothetical protein